MLKNFFTWLKAMLVPSYQDEVTAYLEKSVDLIDLEHREKILNRRGVL